MSSKTKIERQLTLEDVFSPRYETFFPSLCLYVGIAGLRVLYQVSKAFHRLKKEIEERNLDINKQLSGFVASPNQFRFHLGQHGAIIWGGFALNFFEFGFWKMQHLDIMIQAGTHAAKFVAYLEAYEGYKKGLRSSESDLEDETESGRFVLVNEERPGMNIRVSRTTDAPAYAILDSAHITASVNLITWNKAYSVFPKLTLSHHKTYVLKPLGDVLGSVLREYARQGWTTRDMISPEFPDKKVHFTGGQRRVGDSSSLIIPLITSSIKPVSMPDAVVEYAQFSVSDKSSPGFGNNSTFSGFGSNSTFPGLDNNSTPGSPRIDISLLKSLALRQKYSCSRAWRGHIDRKLSLWNKIEFYKLDQAQRPPPRNHGPFRNNLGGLDRDDLILDDFVPPQSWDYADDQLPLWYQEWTDLNIVTPH